jgi:hypothetical protein
VAIVAAKKPSHRLLLKLLSKVIHTGAARELST